MPKVDKQQWKTIPVPLWMYAGTVVALFLVANLTQNPQPNGTGTTEEEPQASNTPLFFSSTRSYLLLNVTPWSSEPASSTTDTNGTNDNNQLAFQHSGGFFDDISDSDWRRLQKITNRTFPNHFRPDLQQYSNHPTKAHSNWWNAENFQEEFHCQFAERLPSDSNGDGPKWVCDPHRIVKQYENKTFAKDDKNTGCLVYSVGSNGNVQFEKAVKDQISADCEVHTFDMRTRNRRNGNFKQALDGYSTFHNWGIGRSGPVKKGGYLKAMGGNLKTLEETVKILGHEGRRIDVFKIDCEQCEWYMYDEWLKTDVVELKQILVETHNAPMPLARDFFFNLHDAGYVIFSKEANFQNGGGGVEFGFLRLSPDFFLDDSLYRLQKK